MNDWFNDQMTKDDIENFYMDGLNFSNKYNCNILRLKIPKNITISINSKKVKNYDEVVIDSKDKCKIKIKCVGINC